jgi:hypothetical protein
MPTMTHTLGPWKIQRQRFNRTVISAMSGAEIMSLIASVHVVGTHEARDANARLIAAAPALLEALREAHRYFRNRTGNEEMQLNEIIGAALALAEEPHADR